MASQTFNYTGDMQKFNVPAGVKILEITMRGGGSGTSKGGLVTGRMRVSGRDTLFIIVGRHGYQTGNRIGGNRCFGGGGKGGDASAGRIGGNGGGGASAIRMNRRDGRIIAVAGGAGGSSGDGGKGGDGGAEVGDHGDPGTGTGSGVIHNATGGTPNQPGKGGTTSAGTSHWGADGTGGRLGRGGRGGQGADGDFTGGGGGGGGFYPGGGGQAGVIATAPGGGGAGGSSLKDGLYTATSVQGGGTTGHGQVTITWEPPGGNHPPVPPSNIVIDGKPIADGLATKAMRKVTIKGTPDDPNAGQGVRMLIHVSTGPGFKRKSRHKGTFDATEKRDIAVVDGLKPSTLYYVRIYTQDHRGKISTNYRATTFWTNRRPSAPELLQPAENVMFPADANMTFTWQHIDPDPNDPQAGFQLRYRRAATPLRAAGDWTVVSRENDTAEQWTIAAGTFKANVFYEWTVRTRDGQGNRTWGEWATPLSFYIEGSATPPEVFEPSRNEAIVASEINRFMWRFKAPTNDVSQAHANLRYRVVGTEQWATLFGDVTDPGTDWFWDVPAETFAPGYRYEWQVQTLSSLGVLSDWSESAYFWATVAPESGEGLVVTESGTPQPPLGVGNNRAYIYDRGGQVLRGEITPLTEIQWGRKRDDISKVNLRVDQWDEAQREFYSTLRTWIHEVVVFRDGVRVWEGPITRISSQGGTLQIEAQDVMAYVYRRVMRQGYNDSYRVINGNPIGLRTVVDRASRIIMNSLSYDDPNVLAYLTPIHDVTDARQSRIRKDYSRTAWEEIDDLAAHGGLDYSVSGRRIILFDTHNPVGRLPEMRDGDFSDPPIVTEYGMAYANYFAVTNNDGVWGASLPQYEEPDIPGPTGWIEQLASSYGETEAPQAERTLSQAGLEKLQISMEEQAKRNISGRYPAPLVVRIPDNSTLNPELNIGINQLVPGVWIPLRATGTIREVSQWQKLDSITVTQNDKGEKISVVMSPAPNGGQDPDAEAALQEES